MFAFVNSLVSGKDVMVQMNFLFKACMLSGLTFHISILMSSGFRICRAKGGKESKMPSYGQLSIIPLA